jgi:uncharacterized membrane protein
VLYYADASLFLVDHERFEMSGTMAILVSLASIGIGWLIYDFLCKSPLGKSDTGLMLLLFVVLVAMAWGYTEVFTGRAGFLHLGAFTATIMSANVFFIIIPNQKKVVADLLAGKSPDPALGKQAKQRSLHNNYLTLPVIFLMLSNHYPLAFGTQFNWIIAALIFLIGVLIRHFFNSMHAGKGTPYWTWAASVNRRWHRSTRSSSRPLILTMCATPCSGAVRCATPPNRYGTGSGRRRKASGSTTTPISLRTRARFTSRRAAATPCRRAISPPSRLRSAP